jgi:hypothetical protein
MDRKKQMFPSSWSELLSEFKITNDQQSIELFGLSILTINILGILYLKWVDELQLSLEQIHLLWFLYLIKKYPPTEFACSTFFRVDKKTFHKYTYAVLGLLFKKLNFVSYPTLFFLSLNLFFFPFFFLLYFCVVL